MAHASAAVAGLAAAALLHRTSRVPGARLDLTITPRCVKCPMALSPLCRGFERHFTQKTHQLLHPNLPIPLASMTYCFRRSVIGQREAPLVPLAAQSSGRGQDRPPEGWPEVPPSASHRPGAWLRVGRSARASTRVALPARPRLEPPGPRICHAWQAEEQSRAPPLLRGRWKEQGQTAQAPSSGGRRS